jgi:predicted nucleotidyltransferase
MTSKLCVPRERATGYLLELLERICAGGKYLDCIIAIHAFGSWSRGAIEVGDVDLNISYDHRLDDEVNRELVRHLATGGDWNTPFRKALKARRALHIMFNQLEMIGEPVLLYERGDSFAAAAARVRNIAEDSGAGRADRETVHPVLEPVADAFSRPSLILMTEMATRGYVEIELLDLPDADLSEISDIEYQRFVRHRWTSTSPLARAATAAGVYLQSHGIKLAEVIVLQGRSSWREEQPAVWAVEAREGRLRDFVWDLRGEVKDWLYVVRPAQKRPLRALHFVASDSEALERIEDIDAWLADNAPHIARIG